MAQPVSVTGEISVTDVRKTFGVTKALDGCNFSASLGEIHAIVVRFSRSRKRYERQGLLVMPEALREAERELVTGPERNKGACVSRPLGCLAPTPGFEPGTR